MGDITIVGSGYVGLVTGACLAEMGHTVTCYDVDKARVDELANGRSPIHEPGLDELIRRNLESGRFNPVDNANAAYRRNDDGITYRVPDAVFVCVGTPSLESGEADISQVLVAAQIFGGIARGADNKPVFVVKSTVPPGTCRKVEEVLNGVAHVVSNPEFLAEGRAVEDFMRPDRVVVGARSSESFSAMREIYEPFVRSGSPILEMATESSEMAKYASNAHLAVRISLMNELALLARMFGADIEDVRKAVGHDHRIGRHFLYAGIGFGGSCFPKDLRALKAAGANMLVDNALLVNEMVLDDFFARVKMALGDVLEGKVVGVWGLAFKPDTDDVREAPAVTLVQSMLSEGATVYAYDPKAATDGLTSNGNYRRVLTAMDAVAGSDALLVLTEWPEFRTPNFRALIQSMRGHVLCDGRNIYDPAKVRDVGFEYVGVGR